jgi:hypothetical protein
MKFNICTNTDNGVGLQADANLLKDLLESWGHFVKLVHFKKTSEIEEAPQVDINLFLEVVQYDVAKKAKQNWLIPNPEWFARWDHTEGLPQINRFLCKTKEATRIFTELYGSERVSYIGFEAQDLYDPEIPRQRKFLHVAGQSRYKNSQAVAYAFAKFFDDTDGDIRKELVFVGAYPEEVAFARDHKNVKYIQRATPLELKKLMNECLFHVLPSGTEGFGQALNEGIGVGAVVITTNFPPMNEFAGIARDLLVPYQRTIPELAAQRAMVGALEVKAIIDKAWKLKPEQITDISNSARIAFLQQRESFREQFKKVVEGR